MVSIYNILEALANTPGRIDKECLLHTHCDNDTRKRVCKMAYDKQILFWTTKAPLGDSSLDEGVAVDIDTALSQLEENICNRKITGGAAELFTTRLLTNMGDDDAEVVRRVITKDLRCGVNASTINKIWKNLIPEPKFMLAETDDKKIVYPAVSQIKADGTRVKLIWDGFQVVFVTRNGNPVETHRLFEGFAQTHLQVGDRIDGELVAVDSFGKALDRKTGNGIVNKAVKGTITKEEAEQLRFLTWDLESAEGGYHKRLLILDDILKKSRFHRIGIIETRLVNSKEEALSHFREARRRGEEGTILKNAQAPWQGKRTFDCVKFKAEFEAEFKVTGYELGTGKNANRIGALFIESADGLIKTDVGIFKDFPESVRDDWMNELPKVVTVLYNERITERGIDTESLFLPRVTAARWDKDEANTRDEIIEIERSAIR